MNTSDKPAGLFGYVGSIYSTLAVIQNLKVEDGEVNSSFTGNTGGIVGKSGDKVSIENCSFRGNVKNTNDAASGVGGIVGGLPNGGTVIISYCKNLGGSVEGSSGVGGIVGQLTCTYTNHCSNSASITAHIGNAGGIIGKISATGGSYDEEISNCYNEGKVTSLGTLFSNTGGILGQRYGGNITTKKGSITNSM